MQLYKAFIPTSVPDPLLCLTVSVTLREKPVPVTLAREALAALIEACEDLSLADPSTPLRLSGNEDDDVKVRHGLTFLWPSRLTETRNRASLRLGIVRKDLNKLSGRLKSMICCRQR